MGDNYVGQCQLHSDGRRIWQGHVTTSLKNADSLVSVCPEKEGGETVHCLKGLD